MPYFKFGIHCASFFFHLEKSDEILRKVAGSVYEVDQQIEQQ